MSNQKSIEDWYKTTKLKKCGWEMRNKVIDKYDDWCDSPVNTSEEKQRVVDLLISVNLLSSALGLDVAEEIKNRLNDFYEKGHKEYDNKETDNY